MVVGGGCVFMCVHILNIFEILEVLNWLSQAQSMPVAHFHSHD